MNFDLMWLAYAGIVALVCGVAWYAFKWLKAFKPGPHD